MVLKMEPTWLRIFILVLDWEFWSDITTKPIVFNDNVFFIGRTETTGKELWKSDGTEEGTVLVKDLKEGTGDSSITQFYYI